MKTGVLDWLNVSQLVHRDKVAWTLILFLSNIVIRLYLDLWWWVLVNGNFLIVPIPGSGYSTDDPLLITEQGEVQDGHYFIKVKLISFLEIKHIQLSLPINQ